MRGLRTPLAVLTAFAASGIDDCTEVEVVGLEMLGHAMRRLPEILVRGRTPDGQNIRRRDLRTSQNRLL